MSECSSSRNRTLACTPTLLMWEAHTSPSFIHPEKSNISIFYLSPCSDEMTYGYGLQSHPDVYFRRRHYQSRPWVMEYCLPMNDGLAINACIRAQCMDIHICMWKVGTIAKEDMTLFNIDTLILVCHFSFWSFFLGESPAITASKCGEWIIQNDE